MARDVREVANAILDRAEASERPVTNMALNKLTYFAHGWFLALYSEPLIDSSFEAWQYGPVHPQLYRQFKPAGDKPIQSRATRIDLATGDDVPVQHHLDATELEVVSKVVEFYGHMRPSRLVEISHEVGAPWDIVWSKAEHSAQPGMLIPDTITHEYYTRKLKKRAS